MWCKVDIHESCIKYENGVSILVRMPRHSEYIDHAFFHPKSMVKESPRKDLIQLLFTDEWVFRVSRLGDSREVVSEKTLTAQEMSSILHNCTCAGDFLEPLIHIPEKIDPVKIQADSELIDE